MTPARGLRILIIGALAIFASCAPLGSALYQAVIDRPEVNVARVDDQQAVAVTPGNGARVVFEIHLHTDSVQEQHDDGETSYQGRYRFPISYRVSDASGAEITHENSTIDWLGTQHDSALRKRQSGLSESATSLNANGGTLTVRASFRTFDVPDDGLIKLSAELGEDGEYGAVAERFTVKVEHDIVDPMFNITLGVFMLIGGWVTAVVGLVLFIAASSSTPAAGDASGVVSAEARRLAMFCHLSGFLGFVIPLGNIIGPLALWIANRESAAYVDDQGREALNFQLSILVYMLLSFALILVLIGLLMFPLLWVFQICMMVVAAVRANDGETYRYPLTIRFLH